MRLVIAAIAGMIVLALSLVYLTNTREASELENSGNAEATEIEAERSNIPEEISTEENSETHQTSESGAVQSEEAEVNTPVETPIVNAPVELPETTEAAKSMIDRASALYYNSSTEAEFRQAMTQFEAVIAGLDLLIESDPNDYTAHFTKALAEYELGEMHFFDLPDWGLPEDHDATRQYLEAAWQSSKIALKLNRDVSDHHRMVAQTVNRLIPFRETDFAIAYGAIPQQEGRIALDLDPKNSNAYMVIGQSYLFTPEAFGGDLDKAIEAFHDALSTAEVGHETFLSHTWLGWALITAGELDDARTNLESALEIYPNSTWAQSLLSEI